MASLGTVRVVGTHRGGRLLAAAGPDSLRVRGDQTNSLSIGQLGEAHLLADQAEDARACADRAVTFPERGERGYEAWPLGLLGYIASRHAASDAANAEAHYGAALALADDLGMRPRLAHCHLGLGTLYRRTGQREQAQEHLTIATTMCREMDMMG
jgi:tetratricopeptide (TPR) repeat protein